MTPKETAASLVAKYLDIEEIFDIDLFCDECGMDADVAKCSALIAVEFAIEFAGGDMNEQFDKILYLVEVKEEIEKL